VTGPVTGPVTGQVLLVAKAPVAGRVKTRLAAGVGAETAARLAAAALLDTIRTCSDAVGADRCRVAVHGDLGTAVDGDRLTAALSGWTVIEQRGEGFGERLAHAHEDVAGAGPVVQVGMDTPQLTTTDLTGLLAALDTHDAALGDAEDGGWWGLALADARHGACLADVPMSTPTTGADTRHALEAAGLSVGSGAVLRDVDTAEDAQSVAERCAPGSEFARLWEQVR
jgi:rSAM/selenodomain-associated transferase 1